MDVRSPRLPPTLSLAAIARSIFQPKDTSRPVLHPELGAVRVLRQTYPVLVKALEKGYANGLLNADSVREIRKSIDEVRKAFAGLANRRNRLSEVNDIRRETDAALKVKAQSSLAAFNEHLAEIAELASRLRDAGYLEHSELLALMDLHELVRRCSREIIVWAS